MVITARPPAAVGGRLRTAVRQGYTPRSSVALLEQLMRTQAAGLVDIVRGVTQRIDGIEDELLAGRLNHKRAGWALRWLLVRLQRLLAPEPAACSVCCSTHPPGWAPTMCRSCAIPPKSSRWCCVTCGPARAHRCWEELAASVQEANSRSLFVLTVVTVLALPINILAGCWA